MDFRDDLVPPRPEGPDSAFYDDLPYTLDIYRIVNNEEVIVERIEGTIDLGMVNTGNWAMGTWDDKRLSSSSNQTYGYYMGFYSGLSAPAGGPK